MNTGHAVPIGPMEAEHTPLATCWCQPIVDYEDPVSGDRVYVHRRHIDGPVYDRPHAHFHEHGGDRHVHDHVDGDAATHHAHSNLESPPELVQKRRLT